MSKHKDGPGAYPRAGAIVGRTHTSGKGVVRAIPLGGVGEVGKNATAIECDGDIILVDAGVKFPEDDQRGIDLVIPDVSFLRERIDRLRGIVLTHGHEDHIGALPFLLPQLAHDGWRVPLYGSRLTLGMVEAKLRERRALEYADFYPVEPGDVITLGKVKIEFISVAHSIPGAFAVAFHTTAGILVMTGDFKFDSIPESVSHTDLTRLQELGEEGVLALLSDCIRIERQGRTPPESLVFEAVEQIMAKAKGRVIVTTFASNIPRLERAIISAFKLGRQVAIVGRSMEQNMSVAAELEYIHLPPGSVVSADEANHLPDEKVVLLTTGSQGEPTSALSRIASGTHKYIELHAGDTVILSAEPVPGNLETVSRTIDNLYRRGANVVYGALHPNIHVSGHASRDELRDLIRLLKPRYLAPVHGEYRHQHLYTEMAREEGYTSEQFVIVELGDVVEFGNGGVRKTSHVPAGAVLVDGLTVGNVSREVLRDRQHLSADGVVVANIVLTRDTGELLTDPEVIARGVVSTESANFVDAGAEYLKKQLQHQARGRPEYGDIVERTKEILGTYIWQKTHLRPLIIPTITEI
jgi:ribonuclease J